MVGDQGSASVVAVVVAAIWFGVVVVGVRVGEVVVTRHRLGAAADLGALAAAGWLSAGVAPACGRAEWVVERMGGRLTGCRVEGGEVDVTVSGEPAVFGAPSARARAGPAEPRPPPAATNGRPPAVSGLTEPHIRGFEAQRWLPRGSAARPRPLRSPCHNDQLSKGGYQNRRSWR
ncbi:Rv3654c family TadE-like protein [Actinosynnema sp. NPDC059335]|uniref:Rv3654c family TadE-like protein n=1 Tax=Actinosynnema sp. NPDC059335 TaxID=3346804 RepID=UPI003671A747